MHWQDIVIATGSWVLAFSLIPTIRSKQKPSLATSMTTSSILAIFVFTQTTLNLWLSAIATFFTFLGWLTLAYQRYKQTKK